MNLIPIYLLFRHALALIRDTPLWLFLAALIIQGMPFNPVPNYLPILIYVAHNAQRPENLAVAAAASAAGAALGKLLVMKLGDYARGLMPANSRRAFSYILARMPRNRLDLFVFAVAASPLPDDEVYILLRAGGYGIPRFLAVLLPAKAVWALVHVLYALATYRLAALVVHDAGIWMHAALASLLTLALTISALRMDWDAVASAYASGGPRGAVKTALKSAVYALWRRPAHRRI